MVTSQDGRSTGFFLQLIVQGKTNGKRKEEEEEEHVAWSFLSCCIFAMRTPEWQKKTFTHQQSATAEGLGRATQ